MRCARDVRLVARTGVGLAEREPLEGRVELGLLDFWLELARLEEWEV